jgi:UDPglucose--hexose-1-phosphate uridylyltransferase
VRKTKHIRPDNRYLYYYSFDAPPPPILDVRQQARPSAQIELRRDPILDEDVIVSTARQDRTFLPPAEYCPLCPTASADAFATEIPSPTYEIVAFENLFPSFRPDAPAVADESPLTVRARAQGACEVIVYSPQHEATLASLPRAQVRRLIDVWADRYAELAARPEVAYVFIFENRGKEIGVTLTHPHGQVYAFPFIPPRVARAHESAAAFAAAHKRSSEQCAECLTCDVVAEERDAQHRIVAAEGSFVAYVPFAARLPYEVHVAPVEHRPSLLDLADAERDDLAAILQTLQAKYDNLWDFPMPYTMSMHQRATDGLERPGDHLHIEFAPPYRSRDKLKYLAGVETGAGTFINDTAPEEKARELRESSPRT